jgi:hypothetical protein
VNRPMLAMDPWRTLTLKRSITPLIAMAAGSVLLVATLARPAAGMLLISTGVVVLALLIDAWRGVGLFSPLLPLFLAVVTSLTIPAVQGYFDKPGSFGISQSSNYSAAAYFSAFVVTSVCVYSLVDSRADDVPVESPPPPWSLARARFGWMLAVLVASVSLAHLVASAGGPVQYLIGLSSRTVALAGQGAFVWLLLTPAAASLVYMGAYWLKRKVLSSAYDARRLGVPFFPTVPFVISGVFLLSTGNRMNLVVYIAAVAYVRHRLWRPLKPRIVAIGVVAVLFLGLALPTVLRSGSSVSNRQLQAVSLQSQYQDFGPVNTFGQAPALALAIDGGVSKTLGTTYLAAITMFIPRSVAPWKLADVGELVTKEVLPQFWYDAGTGVQVGAPGEAYVNFGAPGVLFVGAIAGLGMTRLRRLARSADPRRILLFAVLLPRTALYFRGGFATVTTYLVMDIAVLLVAVKFAERPNDTSTSGRPNTDADALRTSSPIR